MNAEQLMEATGYDQWGGVMRSLRQQGIRYFIGKGGRPWTTVDLVNAAGGLRPGGASDEEQPYNPDDVL